MSTLPTVPPTTPATSNTLDFGRGLRFVFDDPDWIKKVLIGGAMMLLGVFIIGSLWLLGYWVRLIQRVARGEARPMPEWDDWGGMLGDGLRAAGIYFIYLFGAAMPFVVVGIGVVLVGGGMAHLTRGDSDASGAFGELMGLGIMALYGVFWLLMMALMVYVPAAMTRFALTGRFGAGFEFRENLAFIRRNPLNYFLAIVLYMIASFAAQFGVILCCVGVLPVSFWAMCVFGWGLGETARRDAMV